MSADDLCFTPATELSAAIRAKRLSPVELTQAVLARVEAQNPTLNAFVTLTAERALAEAKTAEAAVMAGGALGPLCGIPYTIKELVHVQGLRSTGGSNLFADRVAAYDAPVSRRLREAGGVLLGKTTVPEFGWKGCGDSPLTGITRNPWNPAMNAGGSSSGAGVGAAAGFGALHQGSDGAGSVRIPAAFCGVYGLKPSFGRIPNHPTTNNDNTSHIGPMTRTVADAALMMAVMAGPDDMDRTSLEAPPADYVGRLRDGVRGLKIAFSPTLGGLRVDPDVAALVAAAVPAFEAQGAHVEQVDDPGWPETGDLIRLFWSSHEVGNYGAYLPEWESRMDPGLVACIRYGEQFSVADYVQARARKIAFWDDVRTFFERYDLLLTPSLSVAAFPVGTLNPEHWPQNDWDWIDWASFSYPFNFTGQPAATVPCGFTAAGLPVGLQIVGRRHDDLTVLQASAAFEEARPWADRRPAL